jgi:hypothetical protein
MIGRRIVLSPWRIGAALGFGFYIVIGTISLAYNCIPLWYYLVYITLLPTGLVGTFKSAHYDALFMGLAIMGFIVAIRTWALSLTCYS